MDSSVAEVDYLSGRSSLPTDDPGALRLDMKELGCSLNIFQLSYNPAEYTI